MSKFVNVIAFTRKYTIIKAVITKTIYAHNFIKFHAWANSHDNSPYPVTGPLICTVYMNRSLSFLGSLSERFDGISAYDTTYDDIKCKKAGKRTLYLDNVQNLKAHAKKQQHGTLLTHYSVGWDWGQCNGRISNITWRGKTQNVIYHVIDIFDSINVQVAI